MSDPIEEGLLLAPKFDADGLVTCIATDAKSGELLMVAHMNAEALKRTVESGEAWYFSRSRKALWKKGESSGHTQRVVGAYDELYRGYGESPAEALERQFSETGKYDDFVLVKDISFNSACEHHMMPFTGKAHVAYMPVDKVVGLSKLARLVDVYARRLQTQEHMNAQVATAIDEILKPRGVAVMIEAEHTCMSLRGVEKPGALTVTTQFRGAFRDDSNEQLRFVSMVRSSQR